LLQWVLALLLALVGLVIGLTTGGFGHASGAGRAFVETVWTIGLTVLGFGLGGLLGRRIDDVLAHRHGDEAAEA
jgi:hypothetical protein